MDFRDHDNFRKCLLISVDFYVFYEFLCISMSALAQMGVSAARLAQMGVSTASSAGYRPFAGMVWRRVWRRILVDLQRICWLCAPGGDNSAVPGRTNTQLATLTPNGPH